MDPLPSDATAIAPARPAAAKALALLGVAALLLGGWWGGFFDVVNDVERARALLLEGGPWAYGIFVVLFALFGAYIPGMAIMIPALVWPPAVSIPLSMLGGVLGAIHGFVLARFVARDWVERKLPARFRGLDDRIEKNGLRAVITMRLMLFLIPPTHWALGLSKVRFRDYVLGTTLGIIPWVIAVAVIGRSVFAWLGSQPMWVWAVAGSLVFTVLVIRRLRARAAEPPPIARVSESRR